LRLLAGIVGMLAFGYLGEQSIVNPWIGFVVVMQTILQHA